MFAKASKDVNVSTSFPCLQQTVRSHFWEVLATYVYSKYRQRLNLTYILLTILQDEHRKLPVDMCNNRCMLRRPSSLNTSASLMFFLLQQWSVYDTDFKFHTIHGIRISCLWLNGQLIWNWSLHWNLSKKNVFNQHGIEE